MKTEFVIRPMLPDDVAAVAALEREIFTMAWSEHLWEEAEARENGCYFVAIQDGEIVGYAGFVHILDAGEITHVAVSPAARRQGIAGRLLDILVDLAGEMRLVTLLLEVRESNLAAAALYDSRGFRVDGYRPAYYQNPREAAILYSKEIRGNENI